ncbi:MAG: ThiF family adenylyltransferase [Roseivirga sp.]|nr:ThiF family adenylyltransferase [Roseivirga sp.]
MASLRITQEQFESLKSHLFPGDSLEAVALASCGRFCHKGHDYLLINEVLLIPHALCERKTDYVKWPTGFTDDFLEKSAQQGYGIVKFHSHPGYYKQFSKIDDRSDKAFFDAVYGWSDDKNPHASVVMLPNGEMFGRTISYDLGFAEIKRVSVIGRDLKFFDRKPQSIDEEVSLRDIQAFGHGTVSTLSNLKVAVVGCSGTGSPLLEQLYRLNVGNINITDHDSMETKNLNRIYGSKRAHTQIDTKKVSMMKEHLDEIELDVEVTVFDENLFYSLPAIREVMSSDFIFGCVDKVDAKQLLNHISTYYLVPYIDIGVKLKSDGEGGIEEISGALNYVCPGGPSMMSRKAYSMEMLEADALNRVDPETYRARRKEGYMIDVDNPSPAVISVNTLVAALGVNEMLARIHNFRYSGNEDFDTTMISLTEWDIFHTHDKSQDKYLNRFIGKGDTKPLLGMAELNRFNDDLG